MTVLVIDIGGSSIKLAAGDRSARFDSSPDFGPDDLVDGVAGAAGDWRYDAVSIGYPGKVDAAGPTAEPGNLGSGWVGYDYRRALDRPVRIVNDAVMQALGAYDGGRMLFLGLGTGLGSAIVTERVAIPLELGVLPCGSGALWERVGRQGLEREGVDRWRDVVLRAIEILREACVADYVVIGGGNASRVEPMPPHTRCGGNDDAIAGGERLWQDVVEPHDREPSPFWRVVA
jgi:polyphosphate glucokinase